MNTMKTKTKASEEMYTEVSIPKLAYICSRYSGNTEGNAAKAVRYSRFAVDKGVIPLAPHLLLPLYMDEEKEREEAIAMDLVILERCDELWVFGEEWSAGMKAEIEAAGRLGMTIRRFTEECREVPSGE